MEGINERQMKIITTLNESGFVKVVNLCQQFDVSPVTIRKDLNFLEKKGLLFRTHGGASKQSLYAFERNITEKDFLFGRLDWRKDRFAGVPEQFSQTVGYGRRILTGPVHTLNGELGAGARQSENSDGVSSNDVIFRGSFDYKWQFSETADFTQDLVVEAGQSNTFIESVSAVSARLIGNVSLVASYTIRNNSDVPADTKKTDTRTAIALEYKF